MALLTLTADELQQKIESELSSNPALEVVEERRCPKCHRLIPEHGACPVCSLPANLKSEEPVVFLSPRDEFIPHKDYIDESIEDEPFAPAEEELPTYVLRQMLLIWLLTNADGCIYADPFG
jgi:RNA polymerase sigma-54 factor